MGNNSNVFAQNEVNLFLLTKMRKVNEQIPLFMQRVLPFEFDENN